MNTPKPTHTAKKPQANPAWGGRFAHATDARVEAFSASVGVDQRLYSHDIRASIAHARMLQKIGVLQADEFARIAAGLEEIQQQIARGAFAWSAALEDVHMNIEARLTEAIGDAGKKLHTARSRNDQVATDLRLYARAELDALCGDLTELQQTLIARATAEAATIMPGFTHLQSAQPITFGHHLLAWNEMLQRDWARLQDCRSRINHCPLGSAALAGTGFAIDRAMTAAELGFAAVCENSLDAVSDRDFVMELNAHLALLLVHLSRMAEEIILWCSDAFGFVELGDAFCTGSSIMPQKKNPDVAEIVRGKCARVTGNLTAALMLMKAQPLAYNRDNQEDKEILFDSLDTARDCVSMFAVLLPQMTAQPERMAAAAARGYSTATDLADYLVGKQVPFRDAHAVVGQAVAAAAARGVGLAELTLAELQGFSAAIQTDVFAVLTLEGSVNARDHIGGTAPRQVRAAAKRAQAFIDARATVAAE